MTDPPDHVVIPYPQFLEYRERRRRFADDPIQPQPPTIDANTPPVPNHPPATPTPVWRTS